jgi:LDH2 family malate/lactate/ureidoglycolate dehydrogenase
MRIPADQLHDLAEAALLSLGAAQEEANLVASGLLRADIRGIPTHGLIYLPKIAMRVEHGVIDLPTQVSVISKNGATAHLDGGNGLGMVAANQAMQMSIEMARQNGSGFTLIKNTNNIGLLALYTLQAAQAGMLGICMCNAAASIAPTGGAQAFMGTNPISMALPCEEDKPILVDMSCSVVARGKIRRALAMGKEIEPGWALDKDGLSTTDPNAAMEGSLLPIGGPKGSALALFVDLISGMLSGSKFGQDILTYHKPQGPTGVGVMTLAVDIARFMPLDRFKQLASEHAAAIRNSKKAQGIKRIYMPGEIEFENEKQSRESGVELDSHVIESLNQLTKQLGLNIPPIGD